MKEKYTAPEAEVINFETSEDIRTQGGVGVDMGLGTIPETAEASQP
jgi:hypothetical protein